MQARGMEFYVQKPLLDPDDKYWLTGKYEYAELDPVNITFMVIVACGRIQQVTVAALQILFDVGRKSKSGKDFSVDFHMNKAAKQTSITIFFKFNDQPIHILLSVRTKATATVASTLRTDIGGQPPIYNPLLVEGGNKGDLSLVMKL